MIIFKEKYIIKINILCKMNLYTPQIHNKICLVLVYCVVIFELLTAAKQFDFINVVLGHLTEFYKN